MVLQAHCSHQPPFPVSHKSVVGIWFSFYCATFKKELFEETYLGGGGSHQFLLSSPFCKLTSLGYNCPSLWLWLFQTGCFGASHNLLSFPVVYRYLSFYLSNGCSSVVQGSTVPDVPYVRVNWRLFMAALVSKSDPFIFTSCPLSWPLVEWSQFSKAGRSKE